MSKMCPHCLLNVGSIIMQEISAFLVFFCNEYGYHSSCEKISRTMRVFAKLPLLVLYMVVR